MPEALQTTIAVHNSVARIYQSRSAITHLHWQSCALTDIISIVVLRAIDSIAFNLHEQRVLRRWEQVINPALLDEFTTVEVAVLAVERATWLKMQIIQWK
jgi:hypothetical protein